MPLTDDWTDESRYNIVSQPNLTMRNTSLIRKNCRQLKHKKMLKMNVDKSINYTLQTKINFTTFCDI